MDNREKEILQKINDKTKNTEIPESLRPENIEQILAGKKKKIWTMPRISAAVAACIILIAGTAVVGNSIFQRIMKPGGKADIFKASDQIAAAKDYDEIYDYLHYWEKSSGVTDIFHLGGSKSSDTIIQDEAQMESKDMEAKGESTESSTGGYSDTNVRQEGVGEADYVKTDGKYLYIRKDNGQAVAIVNAQKKEMQTVGSIAFKEDESVEEFYIQDNKLIALVSTYLGDEGKYVAYSGRNYSTTVMTYDVSNPSAPKKLGEIKQSGTYYTTRVSGDYFYVFSQFYADTACDRSDLPGYIPYVNDDAVAQDKIVMPAWKFGNQFMVVSSFSLSNPDKVIDNKAIFSSYGECYVSNENIYVYENDNSFGYTSENEYINKTAIRKIGYQNGKLTAEGQTTVKGSLDSSFCIDEFKGNLRVVTTVDGARSTTNCVYVLDKNLKVIGKIEGLAKDETIYSARFMGDVGYFVTYRQTDPLFSVDLSDPKNPKIIGKLKIPGFSEYLHPFGDGLLLGIGMDMDENGVSSEGVKVSMFDISDPSDVKEVHQYILKDSWNAAAFYDYKAVLADEEKNLIGFSAEGSIENYYLFGYDPKSGFIKKMEQKVNGTEDGTNSRSVYIGNRLYIVKGNIVESYSLDHYNKLDYIIL